METAVAGMTGYAPSLAVQQAPTPPRTSIANREKAKYDAVWQFHEYQEESPGKRHVDLFWSIAKPKQGASLIDIGAGAGAASRILKDRGLSVRAFDLSDVAWTHTDIPLQVGTIWKNPNFTPPADYAYCCDVMEHIPTEFTALSVQKILQACGHAFFSISFVPDVMGALVGEPLHLTVKPFMWWVDLLRECGSLHEARDMIGEGVFYVGA